MERVAVTGETMARWKRQWKDIVHVDRFPTKEWVECGAALAVLTFTEFTVVGPMREQQELGQKEHQSIQGRPLS